MELLNSEARIYSCLSFSLNSSWRAVHDFFTTQPVRNAAVFLLRVVLHDWPDDFARQILLQLRYAADENTKLLIADFVLPLACHDTFPHDKEHNAEIVEGATNLPVPAPLIANLGKASSMVYWMDLTVNHALLCKLYLILSDRCKSLSMLRRGP
jgi:hypothetical protein